MFQFIFIISLALVPFVFSTMLLDPVQSIRFSYLLFIGVVFLSFSWIKDEKKLLSSFCETVNVRNPLFAAISVLFLCTLFSIITAAQKSEAWTELGRVAGFLFFYIWMASLLRMRAGGVTSLSIALCMIGFLLSVFALSDFFELWSRLDDPKALYAMTGHMGHRNLLAIMLSLCLPFHAIVWVRFRLVIVRLFIALNFFLITGVITLSASRVGWIGISVLFTGALVFLIAGYKKGFISKSALNKTLLLFGAVMLVSVSSLVVYFVKNDKTSENIKARLTSFVDFRTVKNEHTETIRERFRLWGNTIEIIKDHPLTGVGAGNWKFHFPAKGMGGIRSENGLIHFQQPHNDLLWVWAETGVIGWLAYIFLFVAAFVIATKKARHIRDGEQFTTLCAAACGAGVYFAESIFDFPKERPLLLFALACFLAIIDSQRESGKAAITEGRFLLKGRIMLTVILTLSFAVALIWATRAYSEVHLKKALTARAYADYDELFRQLDFIYPPILEVDLTGTPLSWYKGEAAFYRGDKDAAKKYFQTSLKTNPNHLYTLSNLGAIHYVEGDTAQAIACWKKALSMAPGFAEPNLNLAIAYYDKGELSKAVELLSNFRANASDKRYHQVITTLLREYIIAIGQNTASPELAEVLQRLSHNDKWLVSLQDKMALRKEMPYIAVWKEAIFTAEVLDRKLTKESADQLRKYYKLPLDER